MIRPLKQFTPSHLRSAIRFHNNFLGQQQQYVAGFQWSGRNLTSLANDPERGLLHKDRTGSNLQIYRQYATTTAPSSAQFAHEDYYDLAIASSNCNDLHHGTTTQFIASSVSNRGIRSNEFNSNIIYRNNHNGFNDNSAHDDRRIQNDNSSIYWTNDDLNDEANISSDHTEDLEFLAVKLKSCFSLQEALTERGEGVDFSTEGPRFSQLLLQDVMKIVRQLDTSTDEPLLSPRELLTIVHNLILPRAEMTIPSHALKALLELAVLTVSRLNPKGRTTATTSTSNITTKTPLLTLDDAICCEELLRKLLTIQIYDTRHGQQHHYEDWNKSLLILMNLTLNLYSTVASHLHDISASRQVVQMAEKLLLESASSSQKYHQEHQHAKLGHERLQLMPDVISFNTVIMAWGKSVQTSQLQKRRNRHSKTVHEAGVAAAERAQAILGLLLHLSINEPNLLPTETSYNVALGAWANVSPFSKIATSEAMQLLEDMVEQNRSSGSLHPPPTAATLVTVSKVLASCSAKVIHGNICKLLQYRDEFQIDPSDIILDNALLTAYARSARSASSVDDNLTTCRHMIEFFDTHLKMYQKPDRVSFLMSLDALQDCSRRIFQNNKNFRHKKEVDNFVLPTSRRLLREAVESNVVDTRMYNDVLGTHASNADEAQLLFDHHPSVDYMAYVRLMEAYEHTAKSLSAQKGKCSNTLESVTELAKRAELILYQLEKLSESNPFLRPQTNLYNAVILTHLERQSLEGVQSAALVLKRLQQKYKQRLQEYQGNAQQDSRICERPNTTSFVSVMAGYLKHGRSSSDVEVVEGLWNAMTDLQLARTQVPPNMSKKVAPVQANTVAMNILLRMYAKYCNEQPHLLKQAEQLALERMIPEPDEFSFTILSQAYSNAIKGINAKDGVQRRKEILDRTNDLLDVVRNQIKNPGLRFYNAVLHTLAQCSSKEAALTAENVLLQEMSSLNPDSYSYAAIIAAWTNLKTEEGLDRARDILLSSAANGVVDTFCFNTVISDFAKLGDIEQAGRLVEVMKDRSLCPTAFTYKKLALARSLALKTCLRECESAIDSDEKAKLAQRGARVFTEMVRAKCTSPSSYAHILRIVKHIQPQSKHQLVCARLIEECKASGQFSSSVLTTLLSIFPESEVSDLLQISLRRTISLQHLPPQWSANVHLYER